MPDNQPSGQYISFVDYQVAAVACPQKPWVRDYLQDHYCVEAMGSWLKSWRRDEKETPSRPVVSLKYVLKWRKNRRVPQRQSHLTLLNTGKETSTP